MPRTVDPILRQMYERVNPNVCEFVEVTQPDVGQVLRRWTDQLGPSTPRISETPASTTQSSPGGGLMLKATPTQIANFYTLSGTRIFLEVPDQSRIIEGVGWSLPSAADFRPLRLKSVKVSLHVTSVQVTQFELQIYRMRGVPGRVLNAAGFPTSGQMIQYTPTPLLPQAARVMYSGALTAGSDFDVTFELSQYQLDIEHRNVPAPSLATVGEIPEYIFEVSLTGTAGNDQYQWNLDTATTRTVAGVGVFRHAKWQKQKPLGTPAPDPGDPSAVWADIGISTNVPAIQINVDTYPATSQEVYAITLPRTPSTSSTGRIVFRREVPLDTSATLEISTAGSSGPWTAATDGSLVTTKQATYHLRSTMNASADTHRSPEIEAVGIEFATAIDVTAEATVEGIPQDINLPFLDAAIGEGRVTVVRTGRRDYRDPASDLLAASAATQLVVDHYLGSRHPSITRDNWLHLGRYIVTSAQPLPTSEILSAISYLKVAKRNVPARAETANAVLTAVSGTTATALKVTGPLPLTTIGDEYDGLNFYVRIVSTAVAGLAPGMLFPVSGNTGTTQIDLTAPGMPAALAISDTFELHSAAYQQPKLSWANADPADVWYEVWTVLLGVPPEKIGRSDMGRVGRSGLPPKLADREPDATAGGPRDKLRVSRTVKEQAEGKALSDELSVIMGGATVEIGGQIVFRQIYDVLDQFGNLVIPAEEVAATLDVRDIATLDTPRGLESRITTMACTYGVDTALGQDAAKPSTVVYTDADAVAWYTQQDLEEIGNSAIPDDVAAWCYNTYDGGQYLASKLCEQIVRPFSTGLRQWSLTTVDMHPDLCVGDRIAVMTDQYTDYDPTRKVAVRGLWAFTIVLTHVARMGRELRGFVPGLFSGVPVRGGSGGVSTGLVAQPSIGNIDFNAAGELLVTVNQGTPPGGGFRLAASAAASPSDATVDAATFIPGQTATVNLGSGWTAGAQVQVKVIAYASSDATGARSLASSGHATVPGGSGTVFIDTLAQGAPNYTTDEIPFSWVGHGVIASYDVYVAEAFNGSGGSFALWATGVTSPYTFTSTYNLSATGSHFVTVSFYVVGKNGGGAVIATSPTNSHNYRAL
jgi:hypothetical protein